MSELKIARRTFLKIGGGSIAATAASALAPNVASAANTMDTSRTKLPYPRKPVAHVGGMALNTPVKSSNLPTGTFFCRRSLSASWIGSKIGVRVLFGISFAGQRSVEAPPVGE